MEAPRIATVTPYRERVLGCWRGKAVGGTLGQQFEGLEGPLDEWFYRPVPEGMVPNDDLDVQVVYADRLHATAAAPSSAFIVQCWVDHIRFPWNEYGVAMRNVREGLLPPLSGSFDNWFTAGEGAAIRSELWACLAPGDPHRAARLAEMDASFDHAGAGVDAARFLSALQSLAFTESDVDTCLDGAVDVLPADSDLRAVVHETRELCGTGMPWKAVRAAIVERFGNSDFTDVRMNTGFLLTGLLCGRDFEERICITNNCGGDTDSTTGSLGALLGIWAPSRIPARWLAPIGDDIRLSKEIIGLDGPPTIHTLTDVVAELAARHLDAPPFSAEAAFDTSQLSVPVEIGWLNTRRENWHGRDLTGLPQVGSSLPSDLALTATRLPGTWHTVPRDDFAENVLLVRYRVDGGAHGRDVKIMFNSTEPYRTWIDDEFAFAAPPADYMFPAPHMAPVGQYFSARLRAGWHDLTFAILRPPVSRDHAEWVIGVVDPHSNDWIPHILRPGVDGHRSAR